MPRERCPSPPWGPGRDGDLSGDDDDFVAWMNGAIRAEMKGGNDEDKAQQNKFPKDKRAAY